MQETFEQAMAWHRGGRLADARRLYEAILASDPRHFDALQLLGVIAIQTGRPREAVALIDAAIEGCPTNPSFHFNRGVALEALGQFEEAIGSYERAIALKPDHADAYCNRGNALQKVHRLEEAIASYDEAVRCKPDLALAWSNRGAALFELSRLDAAIASCSRAIEIDPECADGHYNRAHALLLRGDLLRGWESYEWRWRTPEAAKVRPVFGQPMWDGTQPLTGRTILLWPEQGLGDTIHFCRYASLVADRGAQVIMQVDESLAGLLRGLAGVSSLVVKGDALPPFDYHCPLGSLPRAFGTDMQSIPARSAYLRADPERIAHWKSRLGEKTKPRIGVAWSSTSAFARDDKRSMPLQEFARALPEGAFEFICLQKELKPADRATLASLSSIRFFGDELKDFADTAALADCVDLVVTTCTSVPHLCCALGKPTWILLSHVPDWRWLLHRTDSCWYASATLYRQTGLGDWSGVLARVRSDLASLRRAER